MAKCDFTLNNLTGDIAIILGEMGVKSPVMDGRFHRFGRKLDKSYIARTVLTNGVIYGFCRVFDFHGQEQWQIQQTEGGNAATAAKHFKKFNQDVATQYKEEQQTRYDEVKREANLKWLQLTDKGSSPYLERKGIADITAIDDGIRFGDGVIHISMIDEAGVMHSTQRIYDDGSKRYKGRKEGLIHIIRGEDVNTVYVCEGFSTGASIAAATAATVVVVFDAGNIDAGIFTAQKHFPESNFVIAADNDQWQKKATSPDRNTGRDKANKAGKKFGYPVIYPVFDERHEASKPTDFNDLYQLEGINAIRSQLQVDDNTDITASYGYSIMHGDEELTIKGLAMRVMERYQLISDYSGLVYQYNGRYWQGLPDNLLRKIIGTEDNASLDKPSRRDSVKKEIIDYALLDNVDASVHPNGVPWRQLPNSGNCVVFRNGVYHLDTGKLLPNKPDHYVDAIIPHRHNPTATCPTWMKCLEQWFGDAYEERALALQQFFGYIIMPHARYKKALICFGPPNTGKSEIGKILTRLVGDMGLCSLGFEQMDKSEALAQIKGKYLNLISEPDKQSLINDGNFKKLVSTGEAVTIRHLYHAAEIYTPFAKHVILCNTLPRWNDETDATKKRLLVVEFDRQFADHEQDPSLEGRLASEIEGIANWALAGAMQVHLMNGRFSQPSKSEALLSAHSIEQNPALCYLHEVGQPNELGSISLHEVYNTYKEQNRSTRIGMQYFSRLLKQGGVDVTDGRQPLIKGFSFYR